MVEKTVPSNTPAAAPPTPAAITVSPSFADGIDKGMSEGMDYMGLKPSDGDKTYLKDQSHKLLNNLSKVYQDDGGTALFGKVFDAFSKEGFSGLMKDFQPIMDLLTKGGPIDAAALMGAMGPIIGLLGKAGISTTQIASVLEPMQGIVSRVQGITQASKGVPGNSPPGTAQTPPPGTHTSEPNSSSGSAPSTGQVAKEPPVVFNMHDPVDRAVNMVQNATGRQLTQAEIGSFREKLRQAHKSDPAFVEDLTAKVNLATENGKKPFKSFAEAKDGVTAASGGMMNIAINHGSVIAPLTGMQTGLENLYQRPPESASSKIPAAAPPSGQGPSQIVKVAASDAKASSGPKQTASAAPPNPSSPATPKQAGHIASQIHYDGAQKLAEKTKADGPSAMVPSASATGRGGSFATMKAADTSLFENMPKLPPLPDWATKAVTAVVNNGLAGGVMSMMSGGLGSLGAPSGGMGNKPSMPAFKPPTPTA